MEKRIAIGVDLGGTNVRVALVDDIGRVVAAKSRPTEAMRGPDPVIENIVKLTNGLLDAERIDRNVVAGVGIGAPGPLNLEKGTIIKSANLPGWTDVPLRERLHDCLECRVVLENDANAAAFGEFWIGAGLASSDFVLLTLGTGVGAGVVLNGQILHGHFDNAAELGHTIVVVNGFNCPCGQRGCLEQYASAGAIARRAVEAVQKGESSSLSEFVTRESPVDSELVARHARDGDTLCQRIWDEACLYLAVACIDIQHAYNPATIALGGGMVEAGDFLIGPVRQHLRAQRWVLHDDVPEVVLAKLGRNAGVIGAAGLIFREPPPRRRRGRE